MAGLMLASFASPSGAAVKAVVDSTWTTWTNTVYYFARLSGPNAPYSDLKVAVTAVDRYELYINGQRIDTPAKNDGKWETVDQYSVAADGKSTDVFVAVKVINFGIGNGNGLMVDIKAGADWLGTTTMPRRSQYLNGVMTLYPAIWYYYPGDVVAALGKSDWYNITKAFFDDAAKNGLKPVMAGKMGNLNYTPNKNVQVVSGYQTDTDNGSTKGGGLILRRIEGENIALYKPSQTEKLTDGDVTQGIQYQSDPMNSTKWVDLVDNYRINKVVLYTGGTNPANFVRDSPRGFAVEVSLDNYRYEEMNLINEIGINNAANGGYEYAEVSFPPEIARYVQYKITATRVIAQPHIGEMMIYGTGYTYRGEFVSPWLALGDSVGMKNIEKISWTGDVPEGTKIIVQTRTLADAKASPSKWGAEHTEKSFLFDSPEPAQLVQYRVKLSTNDIDKTPMFKSLTMRFSKEAQPLTAGKGSILPVAVPMGVDTSFVYKLDYTLKAGQDIKTILISVPNSARVDSLVDSANKTWLLAKSATDTVSTFTFKNSALNDSLYITLGTAVKSGTGMKVYFRTSMLKNVHEFVAGVFNTAKNDGAGPMLVAENPDSPWMVSTNTIIDEMLTDVKAVPKVFTPNNDKKNDFTVIEFKLAKTETKIKINIFSTEGTLSAPSMTRCSSREHTRAITLRAAGTERTEMVISFRPESTYTRLSPIRMKGKR